MQAEAAALRRANGRRGQINTAYIEWDNLTLRQELRRPARKTLGFSKNRRELKHALDYIDAHANLGERHQSFRKRASPDAGCGWIPRTRAMAGGLIDQPWTLEELLCCKG